MTYNSFLGLTAQTRPQHGANVDIGYDTNARPTSSTSPAQPPAPLTPTPPQGPPAPWSITAGPRPAWTASVPWPLMPPATASSCGAGTMLVAARLPMPPAAARPWASSANNGCHILTARTKTPRPPPPTPMTASAHHPPRPVAFPVSEDRHTVHQPHVYQGNMVQVADQAGRSSSSPRTPSSNLVQVVDPVGLGLHHQLHLRRPESPGRGLHAASTGTQTRSWSYTSNFLMPAAAFNKISQRTDAKGGRHLHLRRLRAAGRGPAPLRPGRRGGPVPGR